LTSSRAFISGGTGPGSAHHHWHQFVLCRRVSFNSLVWIAICLVISLAWREKEIGFEAVLAGIEVIVAATERIEMPVIAAFDDASFLDNQNLVGAANRCETMSNDKDGAPASACSARPESWLRTRSRANLWPCRG
jgi:hypothetical protein